MSKNLSSLSVDEIITEYNLTEKLYRNLKFTHGITPLENPQILKSKRRYIAQLLTELSNRP